MESKQDNEFEDLLSMFSDGYDSYDIVGDTAEIYRITDRRGTIIDISRRIYVESSDVDSTLSKTATNYVVTGRSEGENAVIDAFNEALAKLPNNTDQIDKILVHLWYSSNSRESYKQIALLSRCIGNLSHSIDAIWGFAPDEQLAERQVAITLIAASKDSNQETESCKTN